MSKPSISLITVSYNAEQTLESTIVSVVAQNYPNLQYIVIDGASTDGTMAILDRYEQHIDHLISEPDKGLYFAMNKGLALATGNIVGFLNADDVFAGDDILLTVADAFSSSGADIIYGDIDFINKQNKVVRKWRSGPYKPDSFNWGWMPPHPSFYARLSCYQQYDNYNTGYGSSGDYELMLRFMHVHQLKDQYVNKVMVKMLVGGVSNGSVSKRIHAWMNDRRAMAANDIAVPLITVFFKPLRKIFQYFS